jgi:ADP-ribosylglycohydrolase
MFEEKIKDLVLSVLVVDSYCLGMHWVYDEEQLLDKNFNWQVLNAPKALWHKGKEAGDFTHYGDQTLWLYEFLKDKNSFDVDLYRDFWYKKMKNYTGYLDSASRNTILNIENKTTPSGSNSTDLSIVGRIAPLLKVSKNKEEFLKNVQIFVQVTHNSKKAKECVDFFARLLLLVLEKNDITKSILKLKNEYDDSFQVMIEKGLNSKDEDSFKAIREFGPACDIDGGFSGVIHLLAKYDNLKEMIINNSKAGGDSSARAMIATTIFMANKSINELPKEWLNINKKI